MNPEKLILFGCDDAKRLSSVINSLRQSTSYVYNIITATRIPDLANLVKSITPDLVVLCFHNNQAVLSHFNSYIKKPALPVFCITNKETDQRLAWPQNLIVFTCPLEQISHAGYLNSTVNSIVRLREEQVVKKRTASLADLAKQDSQSSANRDMSKVVLELDQKIDVLLKVKERIAGLFPQVDDPTRSELNHIVNVIKKSVTNTKLWEDFKIYFVKTNPGFLFLLAKKYPALTQIDLKYCCYLKMNMSNDDIRALLGISQGSIRTHQYRLKKKLSLDKEHSLRSFLQSVN